MTSLDALATTPVLTRQQVEDRLCRPPKTNLDLPRWQAARSALVNLVAAMLPKDEPAAVAYHSHLCDFLRRSSWSLGSDLDWRALLTSEAVDTHRDQQKREGKGGSLVSAHRATLHRAQRALRGEAPDSRQQRRSQATQKSTVAEDDRRALVAVTAGVLDEAERAAARSWVAAVMHGETAPPAAPQTTNGPVLTPSRLARLSLDALLTDAVPVVLLAAALAPQAPLTSDRLDAALARVAASGAPVRGGTVSDVHLLRLHAAAAPSHQEVPLTEKPAPRTKRVSRAALARAADAELDALAARTRLLDPSEPLPPQLQVPEPVAEKILHWQPAKHNKITPEQLEPLRPLLVRLVLASEPETPQKAARLCLHLAGFLTWVGGQHSGGPADLRAHHLWDERLRDEYRRHLLSAGGGARPVGSADTARSEIGWVLHRARPGARRDPCTPRPVAAPYTAAEAQRLVRQARNQPTAALQRSLCFTVALALGAGLDGQDLRHVRPRDITERTLANGQVVLVVRVTHPQRAREVVVLAQYESLLRHALELHRRARLGKNRLVLGEKPDRKNITSPVKARAQTGTGAPLELDVGRMRKHWLVTVMTAHVPLDVILRCAGLTSTRALTDLLPFLAPPEPDAVHAVIRAATDRLLSLPPVPDLQPPHLSERPPSRPTACAQAAGDSGEPAVPARAATPQDSAPGVGCGGSAAPATASRPRPPQRSTPPGRPPPSGACRSPAPEHVGLIATGQAPLTDSPAACGCTEPRGPPAGEQRTKDQQMFRHDTVERFTLSLERGGALGMINAVLSPSGTGRKGLGAVAWCVAHELLASRGRSLTHENVVTVFNEELTNESKALLGLKQDRHGNFKKVTRRHVERVGTQLDTRLSYLPKSAPGLSDEERSRRESTLNAILDAILDGGKPLDLAPTGDYALDGSGVHAWHRRPGKVPTLDTLEALSDEGSVDERPEPAAAEAGRDDEAAPDTGAAEDPLDGPDECGDSTPAAGPRQSKDQDAKFGHKTAKSGEQEIFFGYDLYAMVRVRREGDKSDYPHLVERFRMRPAASDEPDSTLPLIEEMHVAPLDPTSWRSREDRIGHGPYPINQLLTDRAWSYKVPERWADPLRELRIEQVVDLHDNDHGVRDHEGMRIVAAAAHCPAMPDRLVDIRRPGRLALSPEVTIGEDGQEMTPEELTATQKATAEFLKAIEERKQWALVRTANGKNAERVQCPARTLKISCPLIARSDTVAVRESGIPRVDAPPPAAGRPQCCTQSTVALPYTVTPKIRQEHYWGSLKWIKSFARRTHVEGVFGNVKNRNCENLSRGWLQTGGLVRTSIGMAFVLKAYNRRITTAWSERTNGTADPLFGPAAPFYGWREITADEAGEQAA